MSWGSEDGSSIWNGNTDTETAVMTFDPEERGVLSEEYQPVVECVPAEVPLVVPVTGESFCQCPTQTDLSSHTQLDDYTHECTCGEDESGCVWVWDEDCKSSAVLLSCSNRKVSFHPDYSCGTAAIRGSTELRHGQHFWEIKMTSPVYGTDMMVGIGSAEVNLDQFRHSFCSLLGADSHSWGLSYTGLLHHKGSKVSFSPRFGQGSIIGLHLDTWHGTLTFYKNRHWIGVAATGLQNKSFYPMVCSTAAKSSMKVIRSCFAPTSLQYLCCSHLRRYLPDSPDALSALPLPPGLKLQLSQQLGWVLRLRGPEASTHTCTEDSHPDHASNYDPYLDSTSYLDDDTVTYADSSSFNPAHVQLTFPTDSASFAPLDMHLTLLDSTSCTPVPALHSSHDDSDSYLNADPASYTPADTHLFSHPDPASFTPADTHLFSHPDPASFTPADTHQISHADPASFTPVDTHLTSHADPASFTPIDTHLTSHPDPPSYTPADTHLTSHPDPTSFTPVDTHLTSHSDLTSFTSVDTHLTSHPDPASFTLVDTHLTSHPVPASFTPADKHLTSHPDPFSFTPLDTHLTSHPDPTSFTPVDTHLTSHPDPASFTPVETHLTSHADLTPFTAVDTYLTSHPDPASFTPADKHLTSHPDPASFTPVDTHLTSHPDPASFKHVDTHLTSHADLTPFTPADKHLILHPKFVSIIPVDQDLNSYSDSTCCTPAHLLSCHPDSASSKDVDLCVDFDLFSEFGSCSDSASCPCCDAPLVTCSHEDCLSSASYCSGSPSHPASPLPDQPYCSASPLPDSSHSRPSSAPGSDSDSCSSETCQRKRCRWT